jgi:hypothetical protein
MILQYSTSISKTKYSDQINLLHILESTFLIYLDHICFKCTQVETNLIYLFQCILYFVETSLEILYT